jgi:hypothetical protein
VKGPSGRAEHLERQLIFTLQSEALRTHCPNDCMPLGNPPSLL